MPKLKSLTSGRPPTFIKSSSSSSSKTLAAKHTRRIIRAHHTLSKQLAHARAANDTAAIARIEAQLAAQGGLAAYQAASIQGQAKDRGGDSSVELLRWLSPAQDRGEAENETKGLGLRLLEIGALSTSNACSRARNVFGEVVRIDLHSQAPGILEQDFMARPVPSADAERFDVLSLSLVLNFVPDAKGRGEMLWRTTQFLHLPSRNARSPADEASSAADTAGGGEAETEKLTPALFLVLPRPCVSNSRYMTEAHLTAIMASCGYVLLRRKQTSRLDYTLWRLTRRVDERERRKWKKEVLREGGGRNNFCVEVV